MNTFVKWEQTHRIWKQTYGYQRGRDEEEGWIGDLGLAYIHYSVWNFGQHGSGCLAEGTLSNILW